MSLLDTVREIAPELCKADDKALYNALLMHLFRGMSYVSLNAKLAKLAKQKVRTNDIVQAVSGNGNIIKHYKIWVFLVVKKELSEKEASTVATQYNIEADNVALFKLIQRPTLVYLKRLAKTYMALTLEKFNRVCDDIAKEVRSTARKFVWVKMRFLQDHQRTGHELQDFENETIAEGLCGLMKQYPLVQSKLHAVNIVKHIIRNAGLNMIQKYTRQKNNALVPAEGTQSRILDVNNLPVELEPRAPDARESTDLYLDYKSIMNKFKGGPRLLLGLLSGLFSEKFSEWLKESKGIDTPNDELIDRVSPKRYMTLCKEFIGVAERIVDRFLGTVRDMLSPYKMRIA